MGAKDARLRQNPQSTKLAKRTNNHNSHNTHNKNNDMDGNTMKKEKEFATVQWNAGTEFNKLVQSYKYDLMEAQAHKDYRLVVEILNSDLDLTESKILNEAAKMGKEKEAQKIIDSINIKINNCNIKLKRELNQNSLYQLKLDIKFIRRNLWLIQGNYGVLYPYEELKKQDKGDAIKYGFQ